MTCPLTLNQWIWPARPSTLNSWSACPVKPSDYSFVNLWGWSPFYGLEWSFDSDLVWIRQTRPEVRYWAPVGDWDAIPDLQGRIRDELVHGTAMVRVPEAPFEALLEGEAGQRPKIEESRGHWDYLYSLPELVALPGNRFHKKKNLLNQFKKKYDYQYRPWMKAWWKRPLACRKTGAPGGTVRPKRPSMLKTRQFHRVCILGIV